MALRRLIGCFSQSSATSSGGGAAQLPSWTYLSGASPTIVPGKFGFDTASVGAATHLFLSNFAKNNSTVDLSSVLSTYPYYLIWLTDASGKSWAANIYALDSSTVDYTEFYFNWITVPTTLSGDYALSLAPASSFVTSVNGSNGAITVVPPDTGWTANADTGDKTAVIPNNATIAAMQAALNLVVAGFGDAFVAVSDKVKAMEDVLASNKRPNA